MTHAATNRAIATSRWRTDGWALIALLLVVMWLPVTSHEWLESAGIIHSAQSSDHEIPHDAADGFCRLDVLTVNVKAPSLSWSFAFAAPIFAAETLQLFVLQEQMPAQVRQVAPPEILARWDFERRTAPLSRAPSLLS